MVTEISLSDVRGLIGMETGLSDWITVDQKMIDAFAGATDDHQFIHVDPGNYNCLPKVREQTMGINYGFDRVRFMTPVKSGARVRGRFLLSDARFRGGGMLMTTYDVTIEIENEKKPALTARWITIIQFDPKDRPDDV